MTRRLNPLLRSSVDFTQKLVWALFRLLLFVCFQIPNINRLLPECDLTCLFTADATPGALSAHTQDRGEYGHVIDTLYHGVKDYPWVNWTGPDVLFGGGADDFLEGDNGENYYKLFAENGYTVSWNSTALSEVPNDSKALGVFTSSTMSTWLDRNVYKNNLFDQYNYPDGSDKDADDQPGLKEMTLKAIDILHARSQPEGWFLMSEAASIDKQMHALDYDRALGELLELDDTIKATIEKLRSLGELEDTLIVVTADHGHGFDVMGAVDTLYMDSKDGDREKRGAVGVYENSGLSQYTEQTEQSLRYSDGVHFPAQWDPRYTFFGGVAANPDHRENYKVHKEGPREPAVELKEGSGDYYVHYKDAVSGFVINGTLSVAEAQGVHSLTDVPVFAMGPCQELFGGMLSFLHYCYLYFKELHKLTIGDIGVYNSVDVFFSIAECLGLGRSEEGA